MKLVQWYSFRSLLIFSCSASLSYGIIGLCIFFDDCCLWFLKAGHLESKESEPPAQVTVTDICTLPNSSLAAVAIQRQVKYFIDCSFLLNQMFNYICFRSDV